MQNCSIFIFYHMKRKSNASYIVNAKKLLFFFLLGFENFQSTINPEELFRKIFGDAGFRMSGFTDFQDFEESKFGFAPASEVILT